MASGSASARQLIDSKLIEFLKLGTNLGRLLASHAMPVLHIPKQLRAYCGGADFIELEGETVAEMLAGLAEQFPELGSRTLDPSGALASHLVLIQNDAVLRSRDAAEARVSAGDELRLFTAVSGG